MIKTSERLLKLLTLLQSGRSFSASELAQRFELSERSIRHDIERLRELGYPVLATRGRIGGYRLGAGANLPPLQLDDDEAIAIAVGLSMANNAAIRDIDDAARRALTKLQSVLPTRLRRRLEAMQGFALRVQADAATNPIESERLAILANACRDHEVVRVRYRRHDDETSRRFLEPYRVVNWGQRWYLLAWDEGREDWRTFRIDRFEMAEGVGRRFAERPLPDEDVASYISRNVARADAVAAVIGPTYGIVESLGDSRCRLTAGTDDLRMTAIYVSMLGFEFTVERPAELVEQVRELRDLYQRALERS